MGKTKPQPESLRLTTSRSWTERFDLTVNHAFQLLNSSRRYSDEAHLNNLNIYLANDQLVIACGRRFEDVLAVRVSKGKLELIQFVEGKEGRLMGVVNAEFEKMRKESLRQLSRE